MSSASDPKIVVTCPSCGKSYSVKSALAGRSAKCGCGAQLKIPPLAPPANTQADQRTTPPAPTPARPKQTPPPSRPAAATHTATEKPLAAVVEEDVVEEDDFEVEPPVAREEPITLTPVIAAESRTPRPTAPANDMGNSAALRFVGVYGIAIMGFAVLIGLINIAGAIHLALRPNVSLGAGIVIFAIAAFQCLIYFVLFRLGQGLVNCERSAVQGLTVLYVLGLAGAGYAIFAEYPLPGLVAMIVLSAVMVPPMIVAYWNWNHFYAAEE